MNGEGVNKRRLFFFGRLIFSRPRSLLLDGDGGVLVSVA